MNIHGSVDNMIRTTEIAIPDFVHGQKGIVSKVNEVSTSASCFGKEESRRYPVFEEIMKVASVSPTEQEEEQKEYCRNGKTYPNHPFGNEIKRRIDEKFEQPFGKR